MNNTIKQLVFVALLVLTLAATHWLTSLNISALFTLPGNTYKAILVTPKQQIADTNIVMVNIAQLPRKQLAQLIDKTAGCSPKVIAVFVCFGKINATPADSLLTAVLQKHRDKLILEANPKDDCSQFAKVKQRNSVIMYDSVARKYQWWNPHQAGLELEIIKQTAPQKLNTLRDLPAHTWINYQHSFDSYLLLSARNITSQQLRPEALRNKIVYLGYFADELPAKTYGRSARAMFASVNVLDNIINNEHLREISPWQRMFIWLAVVLLHLLVARLLVFRHWLVYPLAALVMLVATLFGTTYLMFYLYAQYHLLIYLPYLWLVVLGAFVVVWLWAKWKR